MIAGNIELISADGSAATLQIESDVPTELEGKTHLQWFYFRSTSSSANVIRYTIRNAGDVSFPKAWTGYQVCASTDRKTWTRVASTRYDADTGALSWDFDHAQSH